MKHLVRGRKFSRIKKQRTALIRTLLGSLIMKEKITTTEAKAKEIKPIMDKIITKVKKMSVSKIKKVAIIRDLRKELPVVAIKKLSGDFSNKFSGRNSGYTRIVKIMQRKSDGAKMAVIEFV
ncbi:MAG TPA: 50S ribosomal protein L17 [Candidatus Moranbacteria bacterium]|nr:50S ribosomal protein L17 [Candidatus Moranbacteria bacterium]HRZ33292.1 50S ribosomal protein L17 [Candidatus Moranbacteria bacterium]